MIRREIGLFRVHDLKIDFKSQDRGHVTGMFDHFRSQIDSADGVSLFSQKACEKTGSCSDIQYAKLSAGREISVEFGEPALFFAALIFPQALGFKRLRPAGPVACDPLFDLKFSHSLVPLKHLDIKTAC